MLISPTIVLVSVLSLGQSPKPLLIDQCERIEVNHVLERQEYLEVDAAATSIKLHMFDQEKFAAILFWAQEPNDGKRRIIAWRWISRRTAHHPVHDQMWPSPTRDGRWAVEWEERDCFRRVVADEYVETFSHYDREVADRRDGVRRGLKPLPLVEEPQEGEHVRR